MFTAADGHLRQHEIYSTSTLAVPRTTHDRWLAYCSLPPKKKKKKKKEGGWCDGVNNVYVLCLGCKVSYRIIYPTWFVQLQR